MSFLATESLWAESAFALATESAIFMAAESAVAGAGVGAIAGGVVSAFGVSVFEQAATASTARTNARRFMTIS